jgi:hypothetical protein
MKSEFNARVERLGFRNQEHVALTVGVTLRTVNGYANGQTVPEPVLRLLRLMDRYGLAPDVVANLNDENAVAR